MKDLAVHLLIVAALVATVATIANGHRREGAERAADGEALARHSASCRVCEAFARARAAHGAPALPVSE